MATLQDAKEATPFSVLMDIFKSNRQSQLVIEVLPSSIAPPPGEFVFLEDGCLGIPKKVLVKAFLEARLVFQEYVLNRELTIVRTKIYKHHVTILSDSCRKLWMLQ